MASAAPHTAPTPIHAASGQSWSRTRLPRLACLRVASVEETTITHTEVATATCMAESLLASAGSAMARTAWNSRGTITKPPPKPKSTVVTPARTLANASTA